MAAVTAPAAADLLDQVDNRIPPTPDLLAVADLARWLAGQVAAASGDGLGRELTRAGARSRRSGEGVVLGQTRTGRVLVVRFFPPHRPTPIHGHGGWGAVVVLDGVGRYETFEPVADGLARLTEVRTLNAGDNLGWPDPPDDVHRQVGLAAGATELTVFARHPFHTFAPQFEPAR